MKNPPKDDHVRRATAHQHGGAGVHVDKRTRDEAEQQAREAEWDLWDWLDG